jgi:hypothetical protein
VVTRVRSPRGGSGNGGIRRRPGVAPDTGRVRGGNVTACSIHGGVAVGAQGQRCANYIDIVRCSLDMGVERSDSSTTGDDSQTPVGRDARLEQIGARARAAGLDAWWTRFTNPTTGEPEGPYGMRVHLRSGRRVRSVHLSGGDEAAVLLRFPFEHWTVLKGYEAILDPRERRIVAAVTLRGTRLSRIPGAIAEPPEEPEPVTERIAALRTMFQMPGTPPGPSTLTLNGGVGGLVVELRSRAPAEVEALHGRSSRVGFAFTIRGVPTDRHDEALTLLEELSAAVFIELDRSYGLTGTLNRSFTDDQIVEEYDGETVSTFPPRMPSLRYGPNAASLYLYARNLPSSMPLLEYLAYYQVIEYYMGAFSRAATVGRIRNMLKDPRFDHNDDVAVERLIDTAAPAGRSVASEREQVLDTVQVCLDETAIVGFLEERPAAAKALRDKKWITGVQPIAAGGANNSLIRQIGDRIYDLRCRIVHSKESSAHPAGPLRPFDPESKRLRHDLHLLRFVAQNVLITSSNRTTWR